jgi:thioesterase domain-containing protein/glutathione synthase/RimK-type ligase-like ATP-grasp enzyme
MIEASTSRRKSRQRAQEPLPDLVRLRDGDGDAPVFVFTGVSGDPYEFADLAGLLSAPSAVFAVVTCAPDDERLGYASVLDMADRGVEAIRRAQPQGPYRLVGYSFGGLVAVETARILRSDGEQVAVLALIDTIFDHRFWPANVWISSQLKLTFRHLKAMRSEPIARITSQLADRGGRLIARLVRRLVPSWRRAPAPSHIVDPVKKACRAAMALYRPSRYPGTITLLKAERDETFACDVAQLWRGLASRLEVLTIPGVHRDALRDPDAIERLARALDELIDPERPTSETTASGRGSWRPKALVVSALPWISAARLALALSEAGFEVEALCPAGHALAKVDFVRKAHRLALVRPLQSLRQALERSGADLVIPCDDPSAAALRSLHEDSSGTDAAAEHLRALITRSLGDAEHFPSLGSRARLMAFALVEGVPCPGTSIVEDPEDLRRRLGEGTLPAMLKADNSWGGQGVAVVKDVEQGVHAAKRLAGPPSALRALKRLIIDRDPSLIRPWMNRTFSSVNLQDFVGGTEATATAVCWRGEIMAMVMMQVVQTSGPMCPATVVKTIDHSGMTRAAKLLARGLGLSGYCGLDFIIDEGGVAHLIELNPRATPTSHLSSAEGIGLAETLFACVSGGRPPEQASCCDGELIALFPGELARDPQSTFLTSARHDIPSQSEQLVRLGLTRARRQRSPVARMLRRARAVQRI